MKKIVLFLVLLSAKIFAQDFTLDSTEVNVSILTDDVNIPWDITWGPDHQIWMTDGPTVKKIDPKTGVIKTIWTSPRIKDGFAIGNGLGFTFHPNFIDTPQFFLALDTGFYYSRNTHINVYRYDYSFEQDTLLNETLILGYYHGDEHSGGRMTTTKDGKIMITTADYSYGLPESSLEGRTLRFNPDGSVPNDNPFGNYTYTIGHRNPQGICTLPNGNIISSEHAQFWGQDELNLIQKGGNYGYPAFDGDECFLEPDSCSSPTFNHTKPMARGQNPPAGIEFYNHSSIPEFKNSILEGVLSFSGTSGGIRTFNLNEVGDSVIDMAFYFGGQFLRIRDICASPSGEIFFISNDRENMDFEAVPAASDAKVRRLKRKHFNHCTPTSSVVVHQLCPGESVSINGTQYATTQNVPETFVNAAGCDSLVIHVIKEFEEEINTNVIIDGNELLVEETNATYQWLKCPEMTAIVGANSQSYEATNSGNYAVEISNGACIDTSNCEAVIITSVESTPGVEILEVYPNPTQGKFVVRLGNKMNDVSVSVYNISGSLVSQKSYNSVQNIELNILEDTGVYFVKIETPDGYEANTKVIKK